VLSVLSRITDRASIGFRNEHDILEGSSNPMQDYREKLNTT